MRRQSGKREVRATQGYHHMLFTVVLLLCPVCSGHMQVYFLNPSRGSPEAALNLNQSFVPDPDSTADIAVVAESRQCLIPVPKTKLYLAQHMTSMHA